jgi:hypothetical protein
MKKGERNGDRSNKKRVGKTTREKLMEKGNDKKGIKETEKEITFPLVFDGSYSSSNLMERQGVLGRTNRLLSFDMTRTS